jgi:hypothetical protein
MKNINFKAIDNLSRIALSNIFEIKFIRYYNLIRYLIFNFLKFNVNWLKVISYKNGVSYNLLGVLQKYKFSLNLLHNFINWKTNNIYQKIERNFYKQLNKFMNTISHKN